MSILILLVVMVLVVGVTLPILLLGGTHLHRALRLRQNDPVDIQTVRTGSDGIVEVAGTAAELDGTVTGKYSDNECLAYEWVHQERADGPGAGDYNVVDTGTEGEPFLLRGETGTIAINPAGANIHADEDEWKPSNQKNVERRIHVDDRLHIYGHKQDVVERQNGLGTESTYIGSNTHGMGKFGKIRARPQLTVGHILGISSDLHIVAGNESDAVRRFGVKGAFWTGLGLIQLIASGLVIFLTL
jgi:hypothetical protein